MVPADAPKTVQSKPRELGIDAIRGVAILLVVLGHAMLWDDPDFRQRMLVPLIWSFHMPLFVFISGFVLWGRIRRPRLKWLGSKLLAVLLPLVVWELIICLWGGFAFAGVRENMHVPAGIPAYFAEVTRHPIRGLWYFVFLAYAYCVLAATDGLFQPGRLRRGLEPVKDVVIGLLLIKLLQHCPIKEWGLDYLGIMFPFLFAGYIVAKYRAPLRKAKPYVVAVSVVVFPLLFYQYYARCNSTPDTLDASILSRLHVIWRIVPVLSPYGLLRFSGVVLSCYLVLVASRLAPIGNALIYIGRRTLGIYAMQYLFLTLGVGSGLVKSFTATVVAVVLSIVAIRLIELSAPLRFALLGGRGRAPAPPPSPPVEARAAPS